MARRVMPGLSGGPVICRRPALRQRSEEDPAPRCTTHRVRLARPGLPVREDADVEAVQRALHQVLHLRKHLLLRAARVEHTVVVERLDAARRFHVQRHVVGEVDHLLAPLLLLVPRHRPAAAVHADLGRTSDASTDVWHWAFESPTLAHPPCPSCPPSCSSTSCAAPAPSCTGPPAPRPWPSAPPPPSSGASPPPPSPSACPAATTARA